MALGSNESLAMRDIEFHMHSQTDLRAHERDGLRLNVFHPEAAASRQDARTQDEPTQPRHDRRSRHSPDWRTPRPT